MAVVPSWWPSRWRAVANGDGDGDGASDAGDGGTGVPELEEPGEPAEDESDDPLEVVTGAGAAAGPTRGAVALAAGWVVIFAECWSCALCCK